MAKKRSKGRSKSSSQPQGWFGQWILNNQQIQKERLKLKNYRAKQRERFWNFARDCWNGAKWAAKTSAKGWRNIAKETSSGINNAYKRGSKAAKRAGKAIGRATKPLRDYLKEQARLKVERDEAAREARRQKELEQLIRRKSQNSPTGKHERVKPVRAKLPKQSSAQIKKQVDKIQGRQQPKSGIRSAREAVQSANATTPTKRPISGSTRKSQKGKTYTVGDYEATRYVSDRSAEVAGNALKELNKQPIATESSGQRRKPKPKTIPSYKDRYDVI